LPGLKRECKKMSIREYEKLAIGTIVVPSLVSFSYTYSSKPYYIFSLIPACLLTWLLVFSSKGKSRKGSIRTNFIDISVSICIGLVLSSGVSWEGVDLGSWWQWDWLKHYMIGNIIGESDKSPPGGLTSTLILFRVL